ncbi:hypothetical protein DL770_010971 [Monosporascus sp. CRB-9-2]|nr:hypothetical protein DL770_010971 [Monosporascus sp. CRB-9-2]
MHIFQVDLGALVDQQLHDFLVPVLGGPRKRRPAVIIFQVDFGATVEQELHCYDPRTWPIARRSEGVWTSPMKGLGSRDRLDGFSGGNGAWRFEPVEQGK